MIAMSASQPALAPAVSRALSALRSDLEQVFGPRLVSLVLYGRHVPATEGPSTGSPSTGGPSTGSPSTGSTAPPPGPEVSIHTLALVEAPGYADLAACAARRDAWEAAHLAMPLLLSPDEFSSSLDVFPLEYGAIIASHVAIAGDDPFRDVAVRREDVRRACEVQAKSHLIHLREGFLQAGGHGTKVARLIAHSIDSFHTLLTNLARLDRHDGATTDALAQYAGLRVGLSAPLVTRLLTLPERAPLSADEAMQWYPPYLDAAGTLARFVDAWKETPRA
jgi:hypothetical protein